MIFFILVLSVKYQEYSEHFKVAFDKFFVSKHKDIPFTIMYDKKSRKSSHLIIFA